MCVWEGVSSGALRMCSIKNHSVSDWQLVLVSEKRIRYTQYAFNPEEELSWRA